jgi:hypothetical protein
MKICHIALSVFIACLATQAHAEYPPYASGGTINCTESAERSCRLVLRDKTHPIAAACQRYLLRRW